MNYKYLFLVALPLSVNPAPAAFAASKAAEYLINEQIKRVCPRGGRFKNAAVIERDLTADGESDLILDLGGLSCIGAQNGTNDECGAAHCPVHFYVRRGGLLVFVEEITSIGARVGTGNPPKIGLVGFAYEDHFVRWSGKDFR